MKSSELEYTDPFRLGLFEANDVLAESVESSDVGLVEPQGDQVDQDEDIWTITDFPEHNGNEIFYRSWDTFGETAGEEPCSAYISEERPEVFDAALRLQSGKTSCKDTPSNIVQLKLLTTVSHQSTPQ